MAHQQRLGGSGPIEPANDEVQTLVNQVSENITAKSDGRNYSNLKAVSFRKQIVAGTNYFVKAKSDDGKHVHLRIFKPLACHGDKAELHSLQHDKSAEDDIEYF